MTMKFNEADVQTILWTEEGFRPEPNIREVGRKLKAELEKKIDSEPDSPLNILVDAILKKFGKDRAEFKEAQIGFDETIGIEHLTLTRLNDIESNEEDPCKISISKIIPRIYICNRTSDMRAKITVSSHVVLKGNCDIKKTSGAIVRICKFHEETAKDIFNIIPKSFELGGIKYLSDIISIESGNRRISSIIDSKFSQEGKLFEINGNSINDADLEQELLETYSILVYNKNIDTDFSVSYDDLAENFNRFKIKQSRMHFYQPHEPIPAKILNFEIEERMHRIISSITREECSEVVTTGLFKDYLSIT